MVRYVPHMPPAIFNYSNWGEHEEWLRIAFEDSPDAFEEFVVGFAKAHGSAALNVLVDELFTYTETRDPDTYVTYVRPPSYIDTRIEILKRHGASMNGSKALWFLINAENVRALQMLLDLGASPNHAVFGKPLLYYATRQGCPEIVDMLLRAGADPP